MKARERLPQTEFPAGRRLDLPAGAIIYRPGDPPRVDLVQAGLVRAYFVHRDGRETTLFLIRPGELAGLPTLWGTPPACFFATVGPTTILSLDPADVIARVRANGEFAVAVNEHIACCLTNVVRLLSVRTLGSVQEGLIWDLLDRAHGSAEIEVTQSELADSVGTSREVVTREMARLREQGLVRTRTGKVEILDRNGLEAQVEDFEE
jgi:CRP/FNR family transcriptional regulator